MPQHDHQVGKLLIDEALRQISASHARIKHCAEQLSDEQLWHRAGEEFNSIANLILHLNGNIAERVNSLIGGDANARNRQQEFDERGPISKSELMARFDRTIARAHQVLSTLPADRLTETRRYRMLRGEVEGSLVTIILHTIVHLGGHTQEIVALTRQQLGDQYRFLQTSVEATK